MTAVAGEIQVGWYGARAGWRGGGLPDADALLAALAEMRRRAAG